MLKTILKYAACVLGPAAIMTAVVTTILLTIVFNQIAGEAGAPQWGFFAQEAAFLLGIGMAVFTVSGALVLGIAHLVRLSGLQLSGCFVTAWGLVTLLVVAITLTTMWNGTGNVRLVGISAIVSGAVLAVITVLIAALHHRLFVRKPKPGAEKAF